MRQQLTVDLASETGPVFGGASGALYGLSEDGVPGADLLAPLHVRTIAQKPPGGLQHPTGDTDKVAPGFFGAGGALILVYLQDIYPDWPYKDSGIADYLTRVRSAARSFTDRPYRNQVAFVPFNEPDWIWYDLKTTDPAQYITNRDRFLADWATACLTIRSVNPDALIVGPNEAYYDSRFMPDFLSAAKAGHVLPDIISWHELSPDSLRTYRSSYVSYRELEQQLGIPPLPVNINEYGNRRDLSVPGQLVQWIAMFEDTKVDADQAYWDIAGNYADNAVQNNMPNGSWWLLRWYGAMTGHTVRVVPPVPDTVDTLCGLASLDTGKRQARVILANPAGQAARVALTGIDQHVFGERVRVLLQSTTWTGYDGAASTPLDLAAADYPVVNGQLTVDLDAMDPMAAYQLTMSPATEAPPPAVTPPWIAQYLAAAATRTNCTVYQQGSADNPEGYATAGGEDVGAINQPDSRVEFQVTVPQAGRYLLSVYYGNQTEDIAEQIMRVDDQPWSFVSYPPTLNWTFRSHQDRYLNLTAGSHAITFGVSDPGIGTAQGQVTLNMIKLAYAPAAIPGVTHPAGHYPAVYADLSGGATVGYSRPLGGSGSPWGYVTAPAGSGVRFVVQADHDGYYDLRLRYAAAEQDPLERFSLLVSGSYLKDSIITGAAGLTCDRVYLHAGINPIEYRPEGRSDAAIDSLDVTPDAAADAASAVAYPAAAPGNVLSGTAAVRPNRYAYGGQCVGGIGRGAASTLTFTGVRAPWAGTYRVILSYASNDRAESGNYNVNLIDPGFTVTTSAGTRLTTHARSTYSWNQFNTVELTVQLAAGENTIMFGNLLGRAPNIGKIIVAPASLPSEPR
jgi:hypothetical protein